MTATNPQLVYGMSERQLRTFAEAQARINLWEGAIRSGKTIVSLLRWLALVADPPTGGQLVMAGRSRDTIARNLFGPLQDPAIFGELAHKVQYTPGAPTANVLGRTVHVIGANDKKAETKLRGMTCAGCYVDEATIVAEGFFRQLLGRMSVRGAKMFATTNPDNPSHWLRRDYIARQHELDMRSWHFALADNPHLDPEYIAGVAAEYTGLWYRRFVKGEWVVAEGSVYDMFDPARHVVSELPRIDRTIAVGVDYGTRNPFAALALGQADDGRLVVTREYRHDPSRARRQLTDADFSKHLSAWLVDDMPQWLVVDPSAASFKVQLYRDGFGSVVDADNGVLDGIRMVSSLLATDRLLIHESCEGLLTELPGYSWDDKAAERGEDRPIKADDHSCDALRYAVATTEQLWRPRLKETM